MTLEIGLQAFDDTRRGLLDEMEALDAALLVAKPIAGKWSIIEIVEHPIAGPLTVSQAVRLGQVHVDGHVRQIRRLRRLLASRSDSISGPRAAPSRRGRVRGRLLQEGVEP